MTSNICSSCGCAEANKKLKNKDTYLADLLRMTDRKLGILQSDVDSHKQKYLHAQQKCQELELKICSRDAEIASLQSLIERERATVSMMEENKYMAAHKQLHELNLQVEHLTKANTQLEDKLKSMIGDTHEAMSHAMKMVNVNRDLKDELQTVASSTKLLEKDCLTATEKLSVQLARHKEKLKSCKEDLVDQHSLYHSLMEDRDRLEQELHKLSRSHSQLVENFNNLVAEKTGLEEVVAIGQGERKSMADRLNCLTVQLQKCDAQKKLLENETSSLKASIASLEIKIEESEVIQDHQKKDIEKLIHEKRDVEQAKILLNIDIVKLKEMQEQLEKEIAFRKKQFNEVQEQKAAAEQARDYYNDDVNNMKLQIGELKTSEHKLKDKLKETNEVLDGSEREKDQYSEQVKQLLDILKVKPATLAAAQIAKSKLKPEEELGKALYEKEILLQERNFLKTQMQKLKRGTENGKVRFKTPEKEGATSTETYDKDSDENETIKSLRSEKEYLCSQMELLQQQYDEAKQKLRSQKSMEASPRSMASSPIREESTSSAKGPNGTANLEYQLKALEKEKSFFQDQFEKIRNSISTPIDHVPLDANDIQNLIREKTVLKDEKEFYQKQYKDLSAQISESVKLDPSTKPRNIMKRDMDFVLAAKRTMALAKAQLEAQVVNLKQDMDDLEKDNLKMKSSNKELTKAVETFQNASMQNFPISMQNFIGEIRKSRDAAMEEVEKIKEEREELRGKLKAFYTQQSRERATAVEDISSLQIQKNESDASFAGLKDRLDSQTDLIESLQDQIQTLQSALEQTQRELDMASKSNDVYKKHLIEKSGLADSTGHQLVSIATQLSSSQNKVASLEEEVAKLEEAKARLESELLAHKLNLTKLDTDKGHLNAEIENKGEIIFNLKNELKNRSAQIVGLETEGTRKDARIQSCEIAITLQQKKLDDEQERCERLNQDLTFTIEQKDTANKEIRRLEKEITVNCQVIKELEKQLSRTRACRDNYKQKSQEYCRVLESLSIAITTKDKEQDTLAQEYLSLTEAISSLKMLNSTLEDSTDNTQQLGAIDEMIKNIKDDRDQLASQVTELLQKIEESESISHQLEKEKFKFEEVLINTRDLLQKEELKRNESQCEAQRLALLFEKVSEEKRSLKQQVDSLTVQLQSDHKALRSLEEVLAEKRKHEFNLEALTQELHVEKSQLIRKISELHADLDHELSEVKRLRNQSASLELERDRLKQNLSAEQYERERTTQELRRVRKYSQLEEVLSSQEEGSKRPPFRFISPTFAQHSHCPKEVEDIILTSRSRSENRDELNSEHNGASTHIVSVRSHHSHLSDRETTKLAEEKQRSDTFASLRPASSQPFYKDLTDTIFLHSPKPKSHEKNSTSSSSSSPSNLCSFQASSYKTFYSASRAKLPSAMEAEQHLHIPGTQQHPNG